MEILCLTNFPIPAGHRWIWEYLPGNTDEIKFLHISAPDRYKDWRKVFTHDLNALALGYQAFREVRRQEYDIVVAWESISGFPYGMVRQLTGQKKVPFGILAFSIRGRIAQIRILEQLGRGGIDFITVTSKFDMQFYSERLGYSTNRIYYSPLGMYDIFRDQSNPSNCNVDFIYSGGRSGRDTKTLIAAFETLNIPLVLNARPYDLVGIVIPENVTVSDLVPFSQFCDYNNQARFVVVTLEDRHSSAMGLTSIIYAMSAGKAVVATRTPWTSEYVNEGETGLLVNPGDPVDLRRAILYLWNNPDVAQKFGERAREIYLERYTFEAQARRIDEVIHTVLGR